MGGQDKGGEYFEIRLFVSLILIDSDISHLVGSCSGSTRTHFASPSITAWIVLCIHFESPLAEIQQSVLHLVWINSRIFRKGQEM